MYLGLNWLCEVLSFPYCIGLDSFGPALLTVWLGPKTNMLWWNLIVWVSEGLSDWRFNNLGGRDVTFRVKWKKSDFRSGCAINSNPSQVLAHPDNQIHEGKQCYYHPFLTFRSSLLLKALQRFRQEWIMVIVNKGMEKTNQSADKARFWKQQKLTFQKVAKMAIFWHLQRG